MRADRIAIGVVLIALCALFSVVYIGGSSINGVARENNSYMRIVVCILSVPAQTRTVQHIEACYDQVEHATQTNVPRFLEPIE